MPRRLLLVALALALAASGLFALPPARAAVETVTETGYIEVRDKVLLHYTVVRPANSGRPVPVLLTYDGYDGYDPDDDYINRFVRNGRATPSSA